MTISADVRDRAYQFFVEEAPELLQVIESELMTIRTERDTNKVHNVMRAAHSLKGGAANVGLDLIKYLAHELESIFKALHHPELVIDVELESLLLAGYDCLQEVVTAQIEEREVDIEATLIAAEELFAALKAKMGDFLNGSMALPDSVEFGIDMTLTIFDVDVRQNIDRLQQVLADPQPQIVAAEIRAQAEVFVGLSELLNLPGFGQIAHLTLQAIELHPEQEVAIGHVVLNNLQASLQAVMDGDRVNGGTPDAELQAWCNPLGENSSPNNLEVYLDFQPIDPAPSLIAFDSWPETSAAESLMDLPPLLDVSPGLDDFFGGIDAHESPEPLFDSLIDLPATILPNPALDDIFGAIEEPVCQQQDLLAELPPIPAPQTGLDEIFGSSKDSVTADGLVEIFGSSNTSVTTDGLAEIFGSSNDSVTADGLDEIFGSSNDSVSADGLNEIFGSSNDSVAADGLAEIFGSSNDSVTADGLDEIFGNAPINDLSELSPLPAAMELSEIAVYEAQAVEVVHETVFTTAQLEPTPPANNSLPDLFEIVPNRRDLSATAAAVVNIFDRLPQAPQHSAPAKAAKTKKKAPSPAAVPAKGLSVKIGLEKLDRMNNLVGELSIGRNSLALQNQQIQLTLRRLNQKFAEFQELSSKLQQVADKMLTERRNTGNFQDAITAASEFDSLEMDRYTALHSTLQDSIEQIVQIEESIEDLALISQRSQRDLDGQRQALNYLRDDLMWSRMLPLDQALSRFPRTLRDLSVRYEKPVELEMSGTNIMIEQAVIEKILDPMIHLLRNAFDHGIEPPADRVAQGKEATGLIQLRAYHQGSQTIIEMQDDGRGIDLERIKTKAIQRGMIAAESDLTDKQLMNLIFEPGFSTATSVSELSGRGMGLDIVKAQLQSIKGNVTVTSEAGRGTLFTVRLPLTLTVSQLMVCQAGSALYAFPTDSIQKIVIPTAQQLKKSGGQLFLHWQNLVVPAYQLTNFISYGVPLPELHFTQSLGTQIEQPSDWLAPVILVREGNQLVAIQIDRLITEQDLVIKPFSKAIAQPSYIYGCTILGDGTLIPVVDSFALIDRLINGAPQLTAEATPKMLSAHTSELLLVVDDSVTLRQSLVASMEKAGYEVLQAKDGREALQKLQQYPAIKLVLSDVEMPTMNGFEFLNSRRQDPQLQKIPVVMVTSRGGDKHRRLAKQLGADEYFTKPYQESDLVKKVGELLATNSANFANAQ